MAEERACGGILAMKVLRAADYRSMPWKNGGGTTAEIAVWPPDAGLDDFLWRVSMARIESSGPFSVFSGVDRSLAILEGRGIILDVQGRHPARLTPACDPLSFHADLPASATLISGPVTDLNVMSRRGQVRHSMDVLEPTRGLHLRIEAPQALLFCAEGEILVGWNAGQARLASLNTLVLDAGPQGLRINAESRSTAYLVQFRPVPAQAG